METSQKAPGNDLTIHIMGMVFAVAVGNLLVWSCLRFDWNLISLRWVPMLPLAVILIPFGFLAVGLGKAKQVPVEQTLSESDAVMKSFVRYAVLFAVTGVLMWGSFWFTQIIADKFMFSGV